MPGDSTQTFVPQGYLLIFVSQLGACGPGGAFSSCVVVGTDLGKEACVEIARLCKLLDHFASSVGCAEP